MSYEVATLEDCSSNYGIYRVPSSTPGTEYVVHMNGAEAAPHCTCQGFRYHQRCKHVDFVWKNACMKNAQWHEGNRPTLKPIDFTYDLFSGTSCENCGARNVLVRRAV